MQRSDNKTSAGQKQGPQSRLFTREDFHSLLKRAITTPAQNLLQKRSEHRLPFVPSVVPETILVAIALKILFTDRVIYPANTPLQ
jgi:hypothetical protein